MQLQPGNVIAGKYVLEKRLGKGGMGEVWTARHAQLGSPVALKVMITSSESSDEARRRFAREAKIVANLRSDFIVHVFDHGDHEGLLYIAMDLLEGEDLRKRLRRVQRLSVPTVTRLAVTVGRALRTAHAAGLVHRDLKPANIFLARQDDDEVVKVLDFGIAKVSGATAYTLSGAMLGTLIYMSPEHLRNAAAVDQRADLWSLGVVLYLALTGELPFPGDTHDVFLALAQDPIPPPVPASQLVPGLQPAFDSFFVRAFAPHIQHRFQTAADLVESFCWAAGQEEPSVASRLPLEPREPGPPGSGAASAREGPPESTEVISHPSGLFTRSPATAPLPVTGPLPDEPSRDQTTGEAPPVRVSDHVLSSLREGRYLPTGELGRGGMGRVDVVLDRALGRAIARKSVHDPAKNTDLLLTEAQIGAQLEHPSIVPVYDVGIDDDGPFYTMRVVRGRTLRDILADRREGLESAMSLSQCLGVLRQVCLAVDFAHTRGVIHRDLKPENIVTGLFGEVYVLDWGAAHLTPASDLRRMGPIAPLRIAGTIGYLAPEQLRSGPLDARTDVYALGVLLDEVLRSSPLEPGAPPAFEGLIAACRSSEPNRRPAGARHLADAIDAFLDSERERAERRREADLRAGEGDTALASVETLERSARRLEEDARAMLATIQPWDPIAHKQAAWERSEQAARLRAAAAQALAQAETAFAGALCRFPAHAAARRGLAALYYRQFEAAEARADAPGMTQYLELSRAYDDGALALELRDEGLLSVTTDTAGAALSIARHEQRGLLLRPEQWLGLGTSEVKEVALRSGSYLLVARTREREIRYPLVIARAHRHALTLHLAPAVDLPGSMVLVPGGPFLALPVRGERMVRAHLPDFAIARFPVTLAEYACFLSAIEDPEERRRRTPELRGEPMLLRGSEADWQVGPDVVVGEGRRRIPPGREMTLPAFCVTWYQAQAYARWLALASGRPYRLPFDLEWEKAARGADGRAFPMGHHIDPSFAKLRESRPEPTQPEPIGAFPTDESPYGVRDLAGGIGDWTGSAADGLPLPALEAEGSPEADGRQAFYRGGNWGSTSLAHMRYPTGLGVRHTGIGIRLVLELPVETSSDLTVTPL